MGESCCGGVLFSSSYLESRKVQSSAAHESKLSFALAAPCHSVANGDCAARSSATQTKSTVYDRASSLLRGMHYFGFTKWRVGRRSRVTKFCTRSELSTFSRTENLTSYVMQRCVISSQCRRPAPSKVRYFMKKLDTAKGNVRG